MNVNANRMACISPEFPQDKSPVYTSGMSEDSYKKYEADCARIHKENATLLRDPPLTSAKLWNLKIAGA